MSRAGSTGITGGPGHERARSDRRRLQSQVDCTVDVGIQQRVPASDDARIDALLELAEAVGDHLRHKRLTDFPEAACLSIAHDPVAASEHLDERSTLTTVLSVTYRVRR